jgi:hypothetical protein
MACSKEMETGTRTYCCWGRNVPRSFLEGDLPTLVLKGGERSLGEGGEVGEMDSRDDFLKKGEGEGEVRITDSDMRVLKSALILVGECWVMIDGGPHNYPCTPDGWLKPHTKEEGNKGSTRCCALSQDLSSSLICFSFFPFVVIDSIFAVLPVLPFSIQVYNYTLTFIH